MKLLPTPTTHRDNVAITSCTSRTRSKYAHAKEHRGANRDCDQSRIASGRSEASDHAPKPPVNSPPSKSNASSCASKTHFAKADQHCAGLQPPHVARIIA